MSAHSGPCVWLVVRYCEVEGDLSAASGEGVVWCCPIGGCSMCGMWLLCVSVPVCAAVVRSGLSDLSCPSADERESAEVTFYFTIIIIVTSLVT